MNDYLFSSLPRGIRNNNWLNIKYSPRNRWKGQVGNDGTFCIFSDPVFGIRAARKILKSYLKRNKDLTLEQFVNLWSSTDRQAYLAYIVRHSPLVTPWHSWSRMDCFSEMDLVMLYYLMSIFENGSDYSSTFDNDLISRGVFMK